MFFISIQMNLRNGSFFNLTTENTEYTEIKVYSRQRNYPIIPVRTGQSRSFLRFSRLS